MKTVREYELNNFTIWKDWYFMREEEKEFMRKDLERDLFLNHVMPESAEWKYDAKIGEYMIPIYTEAQLDREASRLNDVYFEDEQSNLDVELPEVAVICVDLGLWNGNVRVACEAKINNLNACLHMYGGGDFLRVYVDGEDICGEEVHHDGINHWKMRMVNPELSEEEREKFWSQLREGAIDEAFEKYTVPLGDKVREVYGAW